MAESTDDPNAVDVTAKFKDEVDLDSRGMSPLHEATLDDSVFQINEALEAGHDLNARDRDGRTPLHWAAAGNSHQALERLIEAGADRDARDDENRTPLHLAAGYGSAEAVDRLIEAEADLNARDERGDTALHKAAAAISPGGTIERLIEAEADPNARNYEQETPLHKAHFALAPDTVERLLKAGADPEARDVDGDTPLHRATGQRANRSMELLLKAKADPDGRDNDGNTPLHRAAHMNYPECAGRLLDAGADRDARNADGKTPLLIASHHPSAETVERLLDAGASHDVSDNKHKATPLHQAATYGSLEAADRLLKAGADPDARDADGNTPLHRAIDSGWSASGPDLVKRLIEGGADPDLAEDRYGRTPLNLAASLGNRDAVEPLLEAKANPHIQDHMGHTALHAAARLDKAEIVDRLLKGGADPHIHGVNRGDTALIEAASHGSTESVERLLKAGADPDARDNDGASALHHAVKLDAAPAVDRLLKGGAHHQAADNQEQTPLHAAAKADASECVNRLLKAGAEIHAHDAHGLTPLELAHLSDSRAAAARLAQAAAERQSPSRVQRFINRFRTESTPATPRGESPAQDRRELSQSKSIDSSTPQHIKEKDVPQESVPGGKDQRQQAGAAQRDSPQQRGPQQLAKSAPPKRRWGRGRGKDASREGGGDKARKSSRTSAQDYAKQASEKVIKQLEKGVAPWQKPWDTPTGANEPPHNPVSKTRYKGLNAIVLRAESQERGYSDPRWLTYKQARDLKAQVRKGERGTRIEYWKFSSVKESKDRGEGKPAEDPAQTHERPILHRTYTVFNAEQIDNMPEREHSHTQGWEASERAERLLKESGADIVHVHGDRAFYRPSDDKIVMPKQEQFPTHEAYYSTAMHEMGHWTGHSERLDRDTLREAGKPETGGYGSVAYAKEELRAEMTSMTVNGVMKLPHDPERHASYVKSWIKVLQDDPNELRHAARDAGAAAEYLLQYDRDRPRVIDQPSRHGDVSPPMPERLLNRAQEHQRQAAQGQEVSLSR